MSPELEPTPEELAEAEALARALDGAPSRDLAELQTASLIRESMRPPASLDGIEEKVWSEHIGAHRRRLRWGVGLSALAAGVLLLVGTSFVSRESAPAPGPLAMPSPDVALLRAQLAAARPGAPQEAAEQAWEGYRARSYDALLSRYGGGR